jgi:hypothetical protein
MGLFGNLFKPLPPTQEEAERSAEVMTELKKRRGSETGKWLNLMARDASQLPKFEAAPTVEDVDDRPQINEAPYAPSLKAQYATMSVRFEPAAVPAPVSQNATVEWVNKLFNEFALQAAAFNSSAQGTHLIVSVHSPEYELEKPQLGVYSAEKKVSSIKGHLATMQWGMLIQGDENKIQVFVVPSERILDFMIHDIGASEFVPFMTIESNAIDSQSESESESESESKAKSKSKKEWHIEGTTITFDTIPLLAKVLLGDLVRIASGSMSETELFSSHKDGLKLGDTVAQGYTDKGPTQAQESASRSITNPAEPSNDFNFSSDMLVEQKKAPQTERSMDNLFTWQAASALIQAMDKDLPWLTQKEIDLDPALNQTEAARLNDLVTKLRTLSGEIGILLADYHPTQGSKYNAS